MMMPKPHELDDHPGNPDCTTIRHPDRKPTLFFQAIIPKYANLVHKVDLTGLSRSNKASVAAIPHFTNLGEIHITGSASRTLFGELAALDAGTSLHNVEDSDDDDNEEEELARHHRESVLDAQNLRLGILRTVAGRLERLSLASFELGEMVALLSMMNQLESLSIHGVASSNSSDTAKQIAQALSYSPKLRHLDIKALTRRGITLDWSDNPSMWPGIQSLTLFDLLPTNHTFDFINCFHATLAKLHLTFHAPSSQNSAPLPPILFSQSFPLLTDLTIHNTRFADARLILKSLANPTVPISAPLQKVELWLTIDDSFPTREALHRAMFPFFPTARELIVGHHWSRYENGRACQDSGKTRPTSVREEIWGDGGTLLVRFGQRRDPFFHRMETEKVLAKKNDNDGKDHEERVAGLAEALEDTLRFGKDYVGRSVKEGDLKKLDTAFKALESLRVLQKIIGGRQSI
ncbi:hypothetical protein P7C70_g8979, partial [Phenoliferia sp. Uapishka_3]